MADADKKLVVGVELTYQNNAAAAPGDIRTIEDSARAAGEQARRAAADVEGLVTSRSRAGGGQENLDLADLQALREARQRLADQPNIEQQLFQDLMKVREGMAEAAGAADGNAISTERVRDALSAVRQAGAGAFDQAALSASKALGAVGPLAGSIGILGAAFAGALRVGGAFGDALADIITDTSALDELARSTADSIKRLGDEEVDTKNVIKWADEVTAQYDRVISKIRSTHEAQQSVRDAAFELESTKLDGERARAVAAAKTPEEKAAAEAEFNRRAYNLEVASKIEAANKNLQVLADEAQQTQRNLNELQDQLLEVRRKALAAEKAVTAAVEEHRAGGMSTADAIAAAGPQFRSAEAARTGLVDKEGELGPKIAALQEALAKLESATTAAALKRETELASAANKAFELGGESVGVIRDLTAAIRAQEQKVTAARNSGSNIELQQALEELERLQDLGKRSAETVKAVNVDMSAAFTEGAAMYRTKADESAEAITGAAEEVNAKADQATKDVTTAAGRVTQAADGATGQIAGSIDKLAASVTQSVAGIAARVETSMTSVAQRMAAMEARLASTEQTAAAAASQAATALSQNRSR